MGPSSRGARRGLIGSPLLALLVLGAACKILPGGSGDRSGPPGPGPADQTLLAQQAAINADQSRATAAAVPGTVRALHLRRVTDGIVYEVAVQPRAGGASPLWRWTPAQGAC